MAVRSAWVQVMRQPRVANLVALTIATAIAVNTAIFSLAFELVLREPPFPDPDRIVHLDVDFRELALQSPAEFGRRVLAIEERVREAKLFAPAARAAIQPPYDPASEVVSDWGIRPALVSPEFTELFGVRPALGRAFSDEDTRTDPRAVLISHELWRVRFGGDPEVIGTTLELAGLAQARQWHVVGVLPEGFNFPSGTNLWIAVQRESGPRPYVPNYARLAQGVTIEKVIAALPHVRVTPLADHMRPRGGEALLYLLGASGLLLLIAWVHVGSFMFSQALLRVSEIGVRIALGASRGRLFGEFATETALVSSAGLALAWLVTPALVQLLVAILPAEVTLGRSVEPDWRTFAYASLLSIAGAAAISLAPAGLVRRAEAADLLRGSGPVAHYGSTPFRTILLTGQVGLATALLYIAGLGLQSFARVTAVDVGFDPDRLFGVHNPAPAPGSPSFDHAERIRQSVEALRRLPSVKSVTTANNWPMDRGATDWSRVSVVGRQDVLPIDVRNWWVGEGYAAVIGAPLLEGAEPSAEELARTPRPPGVGVGLATRSLAARLADSSPVLGTVVRDRGIPVRIVGVIDDLKVGASDDAAEPALLTYYPDGVQGRVLLMRLSNAPDAEAMVLGTLAQIWGPRAPRSLVRVETLIGESVSGYRAQAGILSMVAIVAIALTVVGIAGVVRVMMRARTREIAVRLALGGQPRNVRLFMIRSAAWSSAGGIALGLAVGLAGGRIMQSQLYGVPAASWPVIGCVSAFLLMCCWLAAYWPAAYATRVDPAVTLRQP